MGFFKSYEAARNLVETAKAKELERTYAPFLGDKAARDLVETAKMNVASDPSLSIPPIPLDQLRDEGVTTDDWNGWWGMQPLERAVVLHYDVIFSLSLLTHLARKGHAQEEALAEMRRTLPLFGNPNHKYEYASPDDRPLPRELKGRVMNAAVELGSAMTDRHTSMNALIRERLRAGRL